MREVAAMVGTSPGSAAWSATSTGSFTLREDMASRAARRAMVLRRDADFRARYYQALRVASLPERALHRHRTTHHGIVTGARRYGNFYALAQTLGGNVPDRLLSQRQMEIPFRSLSPEQQSVVRDSLAGSTYTRGIEHPDGRFELREHFDERRDEGRTALSVRLYGMAVRFSARRA
jgi:hypothetical protein